MTLASRINDLAGAIRDKLNLITPRLVPAGGVAGQVLTKSSSDNYAASWQDSAGGGGGGTPSGTAFPSSPAVNDKFYREDRRIEYFYDGTRWLSTKLYELTIGTTNTSGFTSDNIVFRGPVPFKGRYSLWLEKWQAVSILTATAWWNVNLAYADAANVVTVITGRSTNGDAASVWVSGEVDINAELTANAYTLELRVDEVNGSATLSGFGCLTYRLIG